MKRLKYLVQRRTERAIEGGTYIGLENIESATGRRIETESASDGGNLAFQSGEVLFGKLRPYLAKVFLADFSGVCTSEFLVLRPSVEITSRFLFYHVISPKFIDAVTSFSSGAKMPRAEWDLIGNLEINLPSVAQQRAIANFLNRETAKIDDLIAKKERLQVLLNTAQLTAISESVSCEVNSWPELRLRFLLHGIEQGWSPQCETRQADPNEWAVTKAGCVNGIHFDENENKALPPSVQPEVHYEIKPGDILVSRANTRELLGSAALIREVRPRLLLCDKLYRLSCKDTLSPEFLVYFLRSTQARFQIEREATGTSGSMQNVGQDTLRDLVVPVPSIYKQAEVCEHIGAKIRSSDSSRAQVTAAIALLREYRSALVSAAVTGQLDLRQHEKKLEALA